MQHRRLSVWWGAEALAIWALLVSVCLVSAQQGLTPEDVSTPTEITVARAWGGTVADELADSVTESTYDQTILYSPQLAVAASPTSTLYVVDKHWTWIETLKTSCGCLIKKIHINSGSSFTAVAGGSNCFEDTDGTGTAASFAQGTSITGMTLYNGARYLYLSVYGGTNGIRRVDTTTREVIGFVSGSEGAWMNPQSIVYRPESTQLVFSYSSNPGVRSITPAKTQLNIAGGGTAGWTDGTKENARFSSSIGDIAISSNGQFVYVAENTIIRKIDIVNDKITTLAGNTSVDRVIDGPVASARFSYIQGIALASDAMLIVLDGSIPILRKVDTSTGTVTSDSYAGLSYPLQFASNPTDYGDTPTIFVVDRTQVKMLTVGEPETPAPTTPAPSECPLGEYLDVPSEGDAQCFPCEVPKPENSEWLPDVAKNVEVYIHYTERMCQYQCVSGYYLSMFTQKCEMLPDAVKAPYVTAEIAWDNEPTALYEVYPQLQILQLLGHIWAAGNETDTLNPYHLTEQGVGHIDRPIQVLACDGESCRAMPWRRESAMGPAYVEFASSRTYSYSEDNEPQIIQDVSGFWNWSSVVIYLGVSGESEGELVMKGLSNYCNLTSSGYSGSSESSWNCSFLSAPKMVIEDGACFRVTEKEVGKAGCDRSCSADCSIPEYRKLHYQEEGEGSSDMTLSQCIEQCTKTCEGDCQDDGIGKETAEAAAAAVTTLVATAVATSVASAVAGSVGGSVSGSSAGGAGAAGAGGAMALISQAQFIAVAGRTGGGDALPESASLLSERLAWTNMHGLINIHVPNGNGTCVDAHKSKYELGGTLSMCIIAILVAETLRFLIVWYVRKRKRDKGQPEEITGSLLFPAWSLKVFDGEFQGLCESTGVAMGSGCGKYVAGGVIMFFMLVGAIVGLTRHTWKGIKGSLVCFKPINRKDVQEEETDQESGCLPAFKKRAAKVQHWRMRGEWEGGELLPEENLADQKLKSEPSDVEVAALKQVDVQGANFGTTEETASQNQQGGAEAPDAEAPEQVKAEATTSVGQPSAAQATAADEASQSGPVTEPKPNSEQADKTISNPDGGDPAKQTPAAASEAAPPLQKSGSQKAMDSAKKVSTDAVVMVRSASQKAMVKAKEGAVKAKQAYDNMDKTWVWRDFLDRFGGHFDSYYSYAWWWGSWEMVKKLLIGLVLGTVKSPTANGGLMLLIYMTELFLLNFCAPFVDKWQMYMQFGSSCMRFINISCIMGYLNGSMSTVNVSQAFFVTAILSIMPLIINSLVESLSALTIQTSDLYSAMQSPPSNSVAPESVVVEGAQKAVEAGPEDSGGDKEEEKNKKDDSKATKSETRTTHASRSCLLRLHSGLMASSPIR